MSQKRKNKKWKGRRWHVGVAALFAILFIVAFSFRSDKRTEAANNYSFQNSSGSTVNEGGTFTMRRSSERYTLLGLDSTDTCQWVSMDTNVLTVRAGTGSGPGNATLDVVGPGEVAINVTVTHADGTSELVSMTIDVVFSINEYLTGGSTSGVYMEKIYAEDERKALYMNYNSTLSLGDSSADSTHLKLVFGNALNADWSSSNVDVVAYNEGSHLLKATGAGVATITVSYTEGTTTYTDQMKVYVRPTLYDENGDEIAGTTNSPNSVEVNNKDKIGISVIDDAHPEIAIADKVTWVISKGVGEQAVLVRDSLGHKGEDADEAQLIYIPSTKEYRIEAKAGIYNIQFYVKGTYTTFEESKTNPSSIPTVNLSTKVRCSFEDKTVTLPLGGSYNLADAFNIPLDVLKQNFTARLTGTTSSTYLSLDEINMKVDTIKLGTGTLTVTPNAGVALSDIPGLTSYDPITVKITVGDTFNLNIASTTMSVGASLDLYGIIGSNASAEASQFEWSVSSETYLTLNKTDGQYVTVTAKRITPNNSPARVTLAWTDESGATMVAYCTITVITSPTDFSINPSQLELEVGKSEYLTTNLTGTQNITWISSDPKLVKVDAQTGNTAAKVTATDKTGSAVITAFNVDNNAYATCVVTVTAPVSSIQIAVSTGGSNYKTTDDYETPITTGFLFLKAVYTPDNATNTDMVWKSRDESVATIDASGRVTILKEGTTRITVAPSYNPNNVNAECYLTVTDVPVDKISVDETDLKMIKGDTYEVLTTLTGKPEGSTPTDTKLIWSSSNENVATVDDAGIITAVDVGTATIMVRANNPTADCEPVMINVTVRNKLMTINFEKTTAEVAVNSTADLNVIFNPLDNVEKKLHVHSSDESLVTVTQKLDDDNNPTPVLQLTGLKEGMAVITCYSDDLKGYAGGIDNPISCIVTITKEVIPATDFAITPTSDTIKVGGTTQLTPIFTPENTSDKSVTYVSSDESVATVSADGVVTGVRVGMAVIQCTATASGKTASCSITVEQAVTLQLTPSSRELAKGHSFTIKKKVTPSTANAAADWKSSNSAIAKVTSAGKVTGKKYGSVNITCTLKNYDVSATCRVKVAKLRSTVKLNKSSIRINIGQTYRLKKTVWTNGSKNPKVKFKSKNKRIASVGKTSGKIKGKRVGSTVITATTSDSVHAKAKCRVIVIRRATLIRLNKTYANCYIGKTLRLKASIKPKNASIKKVKWYSSNPKVASVLSNGKVTGISEGEVYITAKTTDGSNKKARCYVKVTEPVPVTSIVVAQTNLTMKKGDRAKLSYTVLPEDTSDSIKMASDNTRVVKVSNSGVVKAVGTGTATITITATSGVTTTVTVNVVSLNKSFVRFRQYDTETLMVLGTSETITWYSANTRIATVTNGKILGRGLGTTYIYAYVNGCKMACRVQVESVNTPTH